MHSRPSHRSRRQSFTLVEVLVAIAVLGILVALLGSLLGGAEQAIDLSTRHLTADQQARVVFDRMAGDFVHMVKDPGVDDYFSKGGAGANDAMFFFSEAPAQKDPSDQSTYHPSITLVGYRVNSNFQLERLGKVLDWDGSAPGGPFINSGYTSTTNSITNTWTDVGDAPSFTDGTDPDYRVLADGVFRLSFCFLETTIVNGPNGPTTNTAYAYPVNGTPAPGIYPLDYTVASGAAGAETSTHTHVSGIVVALGILDDTSRIRAEPSASTVTALPDTNMPPLIAGNWANLISSSAFPGNAGLPAAVAGEIRVYQRTFTLDESLFQP